mgnify:CR=1 FL=1
MYLEFFSLREKHFGLTPDPRFLFFSEKHREALDHLLYGIHQREGLSLIHISEPTRLWSGSRIPS